MKPRKAAPRPKIPGQKEESAKPGPVAAKPSVNDYRAWRDELLK
jgi:hypothetical protein